MATYRNNSPTSSNRHRHHTSIASSASKGKKPYKSWLKDGVNGGQSSMEILVRWLSDKDNYAKWRGEINHHDIDSTSTMTATSHSHASSNSNGNSSSSNNHHDQYHRTPKKILLEEIVDQMRNVGIYHRFPKDVASKISTLQSNYRATREWYEVEGRRLMHQGASGDAVHEEIQKRFPYWDALHQCFGSSSSSSSTTIGTTHIQSPTPSFSQPPFSSSGPMSLSSIIDHRQQRYQNDEDGDEDDQLAHDDDDENEDDRSRDQCNDAKLNAQNGNDVLRNSLIQVTRQKEAVRSKRSRDIVEFLRKKRMSREQYLIEKERTRRIRAKAELIKNLTDAGFSKQEISEQLSTL
ncbi:hypothetical protein BX666DRAFT_1877929 [Dichotomocladium elegans]|nr:hypothetical protein BX666DRAFT_1877929 [Dichotomocladium elegans]